jgi:PilZ domain-containing protein
MYSKAASILNGIVPMEKRINERHQVLKAGTISFQGSGVQCMVHNISIGGANLEVESHVRIPDSFELTIDAEDGTQDCQVVWRTDRRIGVSFS